MSELEPKRSSSGRPPVAILGVPLENITTQEALARVEEMIRSGRSHQIVTANVDFLTLAAGDVELRRILFESDLALCDGTPVLWASRLLGNPLPERVAGSDLVPLLIDLAARQGYRLFFLGSREETGKAALNRLAARYPNLAVTHYSPPFTALLEMDHAEIARRIREAKPDILFVCFGCPKQEKWIAMHSRALNIPVSIGVGGTMDFLAGHLKRAPRWMQRTGTEWVFRLIQEPRRLVKRYARDSVVFGWGIAAQWWRMRKSRGRQTEPPRAGASIEGRNALQQELSVLQLPPRFDCAACNEDPDWGERIVAGGRHCVLDFSPVEFVDSTGFGVLIRLQKRFRAANRMLLLAGLSPNVHRALAMMRLETFFDLVSDLETAQRVFQERMGRNPTVTGAPGDAAISWRGEITAANAAEVWDQTRQALREAPSFRLSIDLGQVRFIDSTGLGLMVRARKHAEQEGLALEFLNPGPAVRNVVRVANLEHFLLSPVTERRSRTPVPAVHVQA